MKKTQKNKTNTNEVVLTMKQEMFCREYLIDFNATKAATRAGYSEKTAYSIGGNLLKKVEIQNKISYLKDNVAEALDISAITIASEHKKIAFTNGTQIWNDWMLLKDFEKLPESVKSAISEVCSKTTTRIDDSGAQIVDVFVKVKLYDKQKSLDSLNNMLGFNAPTKTISTVTQKVVTGLSKEQLAEILSDD